MQAGYLLRVVFVVSLSSLSGSTVLADAGWLKPARVIALTATTQGHFLLHLAGMRNSR